MKNKKFTRKLALKKATVANLKSVQLEDVKGGATGETCPLTTCQTDGCSEIDPCRTQFTCTICECWCG